MWFVYILKSDVKKWHYVGSTNSLERRIKEHNLGQVRSTRPHIPLHVIFTKEFDMEHSARAYERLLKDKRIEKERIIREYSK